MRKFPRIAVTVFSLGAAAALLGLWVRSWRNVDWLQSPTTRTHTINLNSQGGRISLELLPDEIQLQRTLKVNARWSWGHARIPYAAPHPMWRLSVGNAPRIRGYVAVPHWFPALLLAMLAAVPWMKWRFTVRRLLVATAVVAAILGVVVARD